MRYVSHRGYWWTPQEKNSPDAFRRALDLGYGIELDVRDACGRLVVSHDPPTGQEMTVDDFLALAHDFRCDVPIALNLKADGLCGRLNAALSGSLLQDAFVFDMSIPDTLAYLDNGPNVFVRQSEVEPDPCLLDRAAGVWLDAFYDDTWFDEAVITAHLDAGRRVCLVSPELHGREHAPAWDRWADWSAMGDERVLLCTDHPEEAERRFA